MHLMKLESETWRVQSQCYRFGCSPHGNNWSQIKVAKKVKEEIFRIKGVGGKEGEIVWIILRSFMVNRKNMW